MSAGLTVVPIALSDLTMHDLPPGFLDEGFVQLPPFQGSAPDAANRPAAVPLKPRASTTTPDCPAPHKGSRENQKQSAKWQSGTVVEQA